MGNERTKDIIAVGVLLIIVGNSVVGWITGTIDLTIVTTSLIGFLGVVLGVKPWERRNDPPPPPQLPAPPPDREDERA